MRKLGILTVGAVLAVAGSAAAQSITYTYDAKGRVIAAAYSTGWTTSYSYDAVDNRTRMVMSTLGYIGNAAAPPVQILAGAPAEIDIAAVSGNPEAVRKRLVAVEGATKGTVSISGDGKVAYTPNPDATGADTFTYLLSDGVTTDKAMVRVEIKSTAQAAAASPTSR